MQTDDTSKIVSCTAKDPVFADAAERFMKAYNDLMTLKGNIDAASIEVLLQRQKYDEQYREIMKHADLFDIEYAKKDFKEIKNESSVGLRNVLGGTKTVHV